MYGYEQKTQLSEKEDVLEQILHVKPSQAMTEVPNFFKRLSRTECFGFSLTHHGWMT